MPGSRPSPVWRTLALAFGNGIAVGIGLTLANKATRAVTKPKSKPDPDLRPHGGRGVGGADSDSHALGAELTSAMDAQRTRLDQDFRSLRNQMMELHREFAASLSRLVDEQIENTVEARLRAIQEQARDESLKSYAGLEQAIMALLETRMEGFRQAHAGTERQLAELRGRLEGHENNIRRLVTGLSQNFPHAAERAKANSEPVRAPVNGNGGGGAGNGLRCRLGFEHYA